VASAQRTSNTVRSPLISLAESTRGRPGVRPCGPRGRRRC
jgi:hypothetical protein